MTRDQAIEQLYKERIKPSSRWTRERRSPSTIRQNCEESVDELIALGLLVVDKEISLICYEMANGKMLEVSRIGERYMLKIDGAPMWHGHQT